MVASNYLFLEVSKSLYKETSNIDEHPKTQVTAPTNKNYILF